MGGDIGGDITAHDGRVGVVVRDGLARCFVFEVEFGDVGGHERCAVGGYGGLVAFGGQVEVVLRRARGLVRAAGWWQRGHLPG